MKVERASAAGPVARSPRHASSLWDRLGRLRTDEGLLWCLKVFIGVRIALALIALVGVALLPDFSHVPQSVRGQIPLVPTPVPVPGWPAHGVTGGWHNLFTSWERLDALWFLRIAVGGYRTTDASAAFFPLYPLAIRAVSFLIGGHPFAASLLVSNLSFLGALVVLYRLSVEELSADAARRAVLYAAVFPTALFFFAPYSESLFLLLVLLSLRWARHGQWAGAAAAGALAALTRNLGMFLVFPLAAEAVHQAFLERRDRDEREGARSDPVARLVGALGASLSPVVAGLAYLGYWRVRTGDWLAPLHAQSNWDRHLTNPLLTVGKGVNMGFRFVGVYPGGYHLLDVVIAVPVLLAGVYALVRFRPIYGLYALIGLVLPLTSIFEGRPLIAFSRYALPVFPVYWAMARWTQGRPARHEVLVAGSAALLGLMTVLFVNWYYVI